MLKVREALETRDTIKNSVSNKDTFYFPLVERRMTFTVTNAANRGSDVWIF